MQKTLRWHDYITININWFALTTRSQVLTPLVIPLLVQQFVGDAGKGTHVGILRLGGLMVAVLAQALMGLLSDRSRSPYGRRRPFIFAGALLEIGVFVLIGLIADLQGLRAFWILFSLYILSMVSSNISHAATQALIPDLVPDEKRGLFSGIKASLELPIPLIFVSFVVGKLIAAGSLWSALIALMGVLLICMLLTMLIPEQPYDQPQPPLDLRPILRLTLMTAAFTGLILGSGEAVQLVLRLAADLPPKTAWLAAGGAGLLGMLAAAGFGVWMSIRIGLGEEMRRNSSFTWWVVNRLAFLIGATNMAGFMVFYLQEKFPQFAGEKAAGPASTIIMFVGVFILLTALPSGWLSDRFGKKKLVALSALMVAGGAAFILVAQDLAPIYVGACLVGGGVGFFYSANWALGTEIVPRDKAGQYLGLSNLAGAGAGAIGAYIGGPIADQMGYVLLMGIYGLVSLFSILALQGIQSPVRVRV